MTGLVDLHLHLLPGVDDGSKSMAESLEMARALASLGYTHLAPSPHHRPEYASRDRALCATRLEELRGALAEAGLALELFSNAENYVLDEALLQEVATGQARLLGEGKVLLVEAPYQGPVPRFTDVVFRLKLKGVTPLIAHPERCFEFEKKGRAAELVQAGALLQLDLGALVGRYGKSAERLARSFLGEGLYAVAASDLHAPVNAAGWVGDSLAALRKAVGQNAFDALTSTRPAALLRGVTD